MNEIIILQQWYVTRDSQTSFCSPIIFGGFKTKLEAEMNIDGRFAQDKVVSIADNHLSQYILTNGDWRNLMPPRDSAPNK